ncbi:hypothetical protein DYY67_2329 [Candidatus Nitrosotalea sp. TS]|nr:hypothetical protein [Candidatus Nitrosotalea sp. TS]
MRCICDIIKSYGRFSPFLELIIDLMEEKITIAEFKKSQVFI